MADITGNNNNEFLDGTLENDFIRGLSGNDFIRSLSGEDLTNGNEGDDTVNGNAGNDDVRGGMNNDQVLGGMDNDLVNGNRGNDLVNGNQGDDFVYGGQGDDTVRGGQNDDNVFGSLGNDVLYGDFGIDSLTGNEGRDLFVIQNGKGTDVITDFRDGEDLLGLGDDINFADLTISQVGGDTVIALGTQNLAVLSGINSALISSEDFTANLNAIGGSNGTGSGTFVFSTTEFSANEDAGSGSVTIDRTGGSAGAASVVLTFSDVTATGSGIDYTSDAITVDFPDGVTTQTVNFNITNDELEEGNETLTVGLINPTGGAAIGAPSSATFNIIDDESAVTGSNITGTDADEFIGASSSASVTGVPGNDSTELNDTISGAGGNDSISGLAGNDSIDGGAGNDSIEAGANNDTVIGGIGMDTIDGDPGNDVIFGGADEDTLEGNDGNDSISGGDAGDNITGDAGADTLNGDDGNDSIQGGADVDVLNGGNGLDSLVGGDGNDTLTGGAGDDDFRYPTLPSGIDTIIDFTTGEDQFKFANGEFGNLGTEDLAANEFAVIANYDGATGAPNGSSAAFIFDSATSELIFDSNGTDAGGTTTIAILSSGSVAIGDIDIIA